MYESDAEGLAGLPDARCQARGTPAQAAFLEGGQLGKENAERGTQDRVRLDTLPSKPFIPPQTTPPNPITRPIEQYEANVRQPRTLLIFLCLFSHFPFVP